MTVCKIATIFFPMSMKYFLLITLQICFVESTLASPRSSVNGHPSSKISPTPNRQPTTDNRQLLSDLNRLTFYKAMEENNKDLVNDQLNELKTAPANIRDAFMGAMIMKKASFRYPPALKLHLFKQGN